MALKIIADLERAENIVGKGEKPAFSPFPKTFSKGIFTSGTQKLTLCCNGLTTLP